MRALAKFGALAAGMLALLAITHWLQLKGESQEWNYWGKVDAPLQWAILVNQLGMGTAMLALLARDQLRQGRSLGIILAVGLLGTTLLGVGVELLEPELARFSWEAGTEIWMDLVGLCLALGLVTLLAVTKRWMLLCLGAALLAGMLLRVLRLVWLAMSFI